MKLNLGLFALAIVTLGCGADGGSIARNPSSDEIKEVRYEAFSLLNGQPIPVDFEFKNDWCVKNALVDFGDESRLIPFDTPGKKSISPQGGKLGSIDFPTHKTPLSFSIGLDPICALESQVGAFYLQNQSLSLVLQTELSIVIPIENITIGSNIVISIQDMMASLYAAQSQAEVLAILANDPKEEGDQDDLEDTPEDLSESSNPLPDHPSGSGAGSVPPGGFTVRPR